MKTVAKDCADQHTKIKHILDPTQCTGLLYILSFKSVYTQFSCKCSRQILQNVAQYNFFLKIIVKK